MISLSLSLMFLTIYGVALQGLGDDTKFGAAGLVMAILGGALLPLVHGAVADATNQATAYFVPAICLACVEAYALFDLRTTRNTPQAAAAQSDRPAHGSRHSVVSAHADNARVQTEGG